jgi:hypothetical protein
MIGTFTGAGHIATTIQPSSGDIGVAVERLLDSSVVYFRGEGRPPVGTRLRPGWG